MALLFKRASHRFVVKLHFDESNDVAESDGDRKVLRKTGKEAEKYDEP